jgi:L-aminopeptidase/D-esterase-like protein
MNSLVLADEINIRDMDGFRIGNAQNAEAKTGVTVIIFDKKARVGIDVSGGGPAAIETHLADPTTADTPVNAIMLGGGSAYGLAAASGISHYLEERGIGYDTRFALVPLVCGSCIYDLCNGSATVRPDSAMGYAACLDAEKNDPQSGDFGAGCGATVGKICGMSRASNSGLGMYAVRLGELEMAAVVAVNALGDVYDPATGAELAGLRSQDGTELVDSRTELYKICKKTDMFTGNTTIGAVITNGAFTKAEMCKIASMTRNAYARCINPVGTMADGDTIYAATVGNVNADINVAGTLAAEVMEKAILNAIKSAGKTL